MEPLVARADAPHVEALDATVRRAVDTYGSSLRVATSLSVEDVIVLDAVSRATRHVPERPRAFFLDTGRLHEETLRFLERVRERTELAIEVFFPASAGVEALVRAQGVYGFRESVEARRACCAARKLEPLGRALAGASAWMTGLRRAQSPTRAAVDLEERDDAHGGIAKISPLAHWDDAQVWDYAKDRSLPMHPLHGEGYPSIGCEPCTRPVAPGEDPRAGRWWWESSEHKECGLHPVRRGGA